MMELEGILLSEIRRSEKTYILLFQLYDGLGKSNL